MAADTITRAQLLLQYYTALSEIEAEARTGESTHAGTRLPDVLPIYLEEAVVARASAA
jgi:hypothetical protein